MDGLIHVSVAGPVYSINVGKRTYLFEMHRWCGPMLVDHRGEPKKPPADGSAFWTAVSLWLQQGRQVTSAGKCVYEAAA